MLAAPNPCLPGLAPAWTFMPPILTATGQEASPGQPLPQPSASSYIVVPQFTYRAVVGVFGAVAKLAANVGSVTSQAVGQGFTEVKVWVSPSDSGFPPDWTNPPTAASIGTSDTLYYVQGVCTGAQRTLVARNSKAFDTQGAQVWEALVWSCQVIGAPPTPPGYLPKDTSSGTSSGLVAWGIGLASLAALAWHFRADIKRELKKIKL